jgi:hypothetical protein
MVSAIPFSMSREDRHNLAVTALLKFMFLPSSPFLACAEAYVLRQVIDFP